MDKKNLLTGRKRISELTGLDAAIERKAELQAMVSLHAADVLPKTVPASVSVSPEPVVPVATVTAVVEPVVTVTVETPAPVVVVAAPASAPIPTPTPKTTPKPPLQPELPLHVSPPPKATPSRDTEYSVTQIADMLVELHAKLAKAGDRNRRHYTPQMQANQIVNTLRELLRDKEKRGVRQGLSTADNLAACRLFIEELQRLLTARGVVLNPLKVVVTSE